MRSSLLKTQLAQTNKDNIIMENRYTILVGFNVLEKYESSLQISWKFLRGRCCDFKEKSLTHVESVKEEE